MERFVHIDTQSIFSAEKMKKNNLFDTERMFCDVYCFEPGQEQSAHAHAGSDKIYFVIDGTATITVGDEVREAVAGSAVLAPAGSAHAVRNPGPQRLRLLVFMAPKP